MSSPAETLLEGDILLYPTDTLYGLGVDALNSEAIKRLKELKGRDEGKPISVIISDMEMAETYAEVTPLAKRLAERFLPGKLTIILNAKNLHDELTGGTGTIGIRIPNHVFCLALAKEFGRPYTATSANIAGEESKRSVPEILAQFGEKAGGIGKVIDAGELMESLPSTVVDARGNRPIVVREGAVPKDKILDA